MKYESPISYHSKDMASVKVFADDRMTGQQEAHGPHHLPEKPYRNIFSISNMHLISICPI
jgi:hypothetical protein